MSRSALTIGAAVAVFAAVGAMNFARTTGSAVTPEEAATRLASVPLTVGAWHGVDVPFDQKQLKYAEAEAHLSRTYVRDSDRASVSVLVLYGEPGPMCAHTPEVCYGAKGFNAVGKPTRRPVPATANPVQGDLWTAPFEANAYSTAVEQVTWAWGTGDSWKASDRPRVEFVSLPRLYKLYVSRTATRTTDERATDPTDDFLAAFLPALRTSLVGSLAADTPTTIPPPAVPGGRDGIGSPGAAIP